MASPLIQLLREKQEYLSLLRTSMDEDAFQTTAALRMNEMLGAIRALTSLPVAVATEFLRDLGTGPFTEANKRVLVTALNGVASGNTEAPSGSPTGRAARANLQKHNYIQNYLTANDWEILQNPKIDFNTKARTVIARISSLGINHPTEGTMVLLTALLYLAAHQGPPGTLQVSANTAYSTLCDLKVILRNWRSRAQATLQDYPQDPQELKLELGALYATAYAEGEPVASRVDERGLQALRACIPARKTHTSVGTPMRMNSKDQDITGVLGQILRQATTDQGGIPGLTIFNRGQQGMRLGNQRASPGPLALTDGSPDQGVPAHTFPQPSSSAATDVRVATAAAINEGLPATSKVDAPEIAGSEQAKNVADMAADLLKKLGKKSAMDAVKKRPASSHATPKEGPSHKAMKKEKPSAKSTKKDSDTDDWAKFPGIKQEPPKYYKNMKIYTSTKSTSWRVQKKGDKKDKAFSWKKDPEEVWKQMVAYVHEHAN